MPFVLKGAVKTVALVSVAWLMVNVWEDVIMLGLTRYAGLRRTDLRSMLLLALVLTVLCLAMLRALNLDFPALLGVTFK